MESDEMRPETPDIVHLERPPNGVEPAYKYWTAYELWHQFVGDITARDFTHPEERLPALSNLAQSTSSFRRKFRSSRNLDTTERYLAGLWETTIHADLCWEADTSQTPKDLSLARPSAPSWSWASQDVQIAFPTGRGLGQASLGYMPLADLVDAQVQLATRDPFGGVLDSWLLLRGYIRPVIAVLSERNRRPYECGRSVLVQDSSAERHGFRLWGHLDPTVCVDEDSPMLMHCLPVVKNGRDDPEFWSREGIKVDLINGHNRVWCLLLVEKGSLWHGEKPIKQQTLESPQSASSDEYERAGIAMFDIENWHEFMVWLCEYPRRDVVIR
jgi:hypothetical protein